MRRVVILEKKVWRYQSGNQKS